MGLHRNQHQGQFGESFVRVLASAAGLIVARAELDVTGEDLTISYKGVVGHTRHPKIEVQVKSWSRPVCRGEHWQYHLRARHFNELAGSDFALPRFLVLVVVPDHWADYATVSPDSMQVKYAAYWRSLRDHERVDLAPDTKIPVPAPCANLLTVDALHAMLHDEHKRREA
ncbi:MAG: DUF4365 domain-containing protein [Pseudonocardiaceae bacterium]